jgi:hypothetical protein
MEPHFRALQKSGVLQTKGFQNPGPQTLDLDPRFRCFFHINASSDDAEEEHRETWGKSGEVSTSPDSLKA